MYSWIQMFLAPTQKLSSDDNIHSQIELLNKRIEQLEKYNRELITILQDFSDKIDSIHPVIYNIHDSKKST